MLGLPLTVALSLCLPACAQRPEEGWAKALDRYADIAEEAGRAPLPEARRKEAADILSGFKALISSPAYAAAPLARPIPLRERSPRRQARAVILLLQDMADIQRALADHPSGRRSVELQQALMSDRRDAGALLERMAGLPEPPARPPAKRNALLSCGKAFRMAGHFQAEFPCWRWSFLSRERSESLLPPLLAGAAQERGLWIDDGQPAGAQAKIYRFRWKQKGKDAEPGRLAQEAVLRPDMSGLAARESVSEAVLYPELRGTGFQLRGFSLDRSADTPCEKPPDAYWSVQLSAVHWPTDLSCRSWLSRWKPPLPGRRAGPWKRIEAARGRKRGAGAVFNKAYETTYEASLRHCGRPVRMIPRRIRVLCAKGPQGLYVFTLDATKGIFDEAAPVLDRIRGTFRLSEETPAP